MNSVDNGSLTVPSTFPTPFGNTQTLATQYQVELGGAVGFWTSNTVGGPLDTYLNRTSANKLSVGSTMGTAHDGNFDAANISANTTMTVAEQNVCQANGTNCLLSSAAAGTLTGNTLNPTEANSSLSSVVSLNSLSVTGSVSAGTVSAGKDFTGTKTAGRGVFTIVNGIITNVTGAEAKTY